MDRVAVWLKFDVGTGCCGGEWCHIWVRIGRASVVGELIAARPLTSKLTNPSPNGVWAKDTRPITRTTMRAPQTLWAMAKNVMPSKKRALAADVTELPRPAWGSGSATAFTCSLDPIA